MKFLLILLILLFLGHAWFNRGHHRTVPSIFENECHYLKDSSVKLVDLVKQKCGFGTTLGESGSKKTGDPFSTQQSGSRSSTELVDPHAALQGIAQKLLNSPAVDAEKKRVQDLNKEINKATP